MKAICRVAKIKAQGSAQGKTDHNYRLREVSNSDPNRRILNEEFINKTGKDIWSLCNERIENAGVKRNIRPDAVRGMEFLLTASPEFFKRNDEGICDDVKNSEWAKENLDFMKKKYGENLVAFTLHQDEKTPHIHAIVVPITAEKKLSAKILFNPQTLQQLQTDYALAMSKFGLERGLEGSKASHTSMKQVYGIHKTIEELKTDVIEGKSLQKDLSSLKTQKNDLVQEFTIYKSQAETRIVNLTQEASKIKNSTEIAKSGLELLKSEKNRLDKEIDTLVSAKKNIESTSGLERANLNFLKSKAEELRIEIVKMESQKKEIKIEPQHREIEF